MSKFVLPDGTEYPLILRDITNKDAKLLQSITGMKYIELVTDLESGGPDGKGAFVWLAMRKSGVDVPFDELEFPMGTKFVLDEVDPTKASPATAKDAPSARTKSTAGRASKPK